MQTFINLNITLEYIFIEQLILFCDCDATIKELNNIKKTKISWFIRNVDLDKKLFYLEQAINNKTFKEEKEVLDSLKAIEIVKNEIFKLQEMKSLEDIYKNKILPFYSFDFIENYRNVLLSLNIENFQTMSEFQKKTQLTVLELELELNLNLSEDLKSSIKNKIQQLIKEL